jgi:aminoglycoside phosphotransferase (APT) family kinase protein
MFNWVANQLGGGAIVTATRSLHGGESPWRVDLRLAGGLELAVVVRSPTSRITREMIVTNAAALTVAERHGLTAPRLLAADLDGREAGEPTSVETIIEGTTVWPAECPADLLRAAGAAVARVHEIVFEPSAFLPYRPRPIAVDDFAGERRLGRMRTTDLLRSADELIRAAPTPEGRAVFVHGDVWPGNILVAGDRVSALIDWKTAGVGHPGVDLGELRKQAAIFYGAEGPRYVLEGWERASGSRAQDVAYWDATAALNTPTESNGPAEAARRDDFLRAAVARI